MVATAENAGEADCAPAANACSLASPKIHQLGSALGQHHVAGLQVTVHDAAAVRLVERVGDFDSNAQSLVWRQRLARQARGQGFAFQVLHHQEVHAVLAADIVENADVGVLQARDGPGLTLKPGAEIRIRTEVGGKDFDGDGALQPRVARLVDLAHAARAQCADDLIRPELGAGGQGHFCLSSAVQLVTKVIGLEACWGVAITMKRWPSPVTS
jgi:hypothetical protein